jgi:hypothetical protein
VVRSPAIYLLVISLPTCFNVNVLLRRYCDPCRLKVRPHNLKCELCENVGGAYKATDQGNRWVHSSCFLCIPEVFSVDQADGNYKICLNFLDAKRFKLRCALCKKGGACIQCAYGRCATPAHPWCLLHDSQGFDHARVASSEFLMFCAQHAQYKNKMLEESEAAAGDGESVVCKSDATGKPRKSKGELAPKRPKTPVSSGSLVGRAILRDFGKNGMFMGYIRSYLEPYYLVEYPIDGDREELTEAQCWPLLLRGESELGDK